MSGSANEEPRTGEVTSLLAAWREGDAAALDQVVRLEALPAAGEHSCGGCGCWRCLRRF